MTKALQSVKYANGKSSGRPNMSTLFTNVWHFGHAAFIVVKCLLCLECKMGSTIGEYTIH